MQQELAESFKVGVDDFRQNVDTLTIRDVVNKSNERLRGDTSRIIIGRSRKREGVYREYFLLRSIGFNI